MKKHVQLVIVLLLLNWLIPVSIWAQDIEEIADAVLKLPRTLLGEQQIVDGQLYSGKVPLVGNRNINVSCGCQGQVSGASYSRFGPDFGALSQLHPRSGNVNKRPHHVAPYRKCHGKN